METSPSNSRVNKANAEPLNNEHIDLDLRCVDEVMNGMHIYGLPITIGNGSIRFECQNQTEPFKFFES